MKFISFLFHAYQPPTQDLKILKQINSECYKPVFSLLDDYEDIKLSLNINGVLIELLYEHGLGDTVDLIKNLVSQNKVEILGTPNFHPILPLIPEKEVYHQIQMNEELNRKVFGDIWKRRGFFPPELAISPKLLKIIHSLGYKWVIMSGIACPEEWPYDKIYKSDLGLKLFFRDDILSNKIAFKQIKPKEFLKNIINLYEGNAYIPICLDIETFGWHIKNYEKSFLGKVLDMILNNEKSDDKNVRYKEEIKVFFISDLDQYFPIAKKAIIPKESSWSTSYEDILDEIPYPLWKHPDNNIHKYYWKIVKSLNKLMDLANNLDLTEKWEIENYYNTARWFYDRGLHSCPIWWANPQNGTWSPNLIYSGLELLLKAALNAQMALIYAGKDDGDANFDSISYYHGLLLMELYTITKKNLKHRKKQTKESD